MEHMRTMIILEVLINKPHQKAKQISTVTNLEIYIVYKLLDKISAIGLLHKARVGERAFRPAHVYSMTELGKLYFDAYAYDLHSAKKILQ